MKTSDLYISDGKPTEARKSEDQINNTRKEFSEISYRDNNNNSFEKDNGNRKSINKYLLNHKLPPSKPLKRLCVVDPVNSKGFE